MTLQSAYDLLKTRWPGRSFLIQCDVWHFAHEQGHQRTQVSWRVYDAEHHESWTAPSLEAALELAGGCDADLVDLAAVERTISRFPDGSGYVLHGPLTQKGEGT